MPPAFAVAVSFCHHNGIRAGFGNAQHSGDEFSCTRAAIGTDGGRDDSQMRCHFAEFGRCDAHHGAAIGVEAHGGDNGQAAFGCALDGGFQFFLAGHGFDPDDIRATLLQRMGLFFECGHAIGMGERAYGLEDFARGANGTGHDDGAIHSISFRTGVFGGGDVHIGHAVLQIMQLQAIAVAAEGIGENNVGSCRDEPLVQIAHALRVVEIPHFRGVARG